MEKIGKVDPCKFDDDILFHSFGDDYTHEYIKYSKYYMKRG